MGWTTSRPEKPGYYWLVHYHLAVRMPPELVWIAKTKDGDVVSGRSIGTVSVASLPEEDAWSQILPPEYKA